MISVLETVKEPNCVQSFMLSYFIICLLFIPSARCTGAFVERERERDRDRDRDRDRETETDRDRDRQRQRDREFAFVYIYI